MDFHCRLCGTVKVAPNAICPNAANHPTYQTSRQLVTIIHVYNDGTVETVEVKKP